MGGFVRGKVECYICNKDQNYNYQNVFKNLYDFFTSHPGYTLIALNYGSTNGPAATGAGTGTGYCDQITTNTTPAAQTFGNNAFFVVRQNASPARLFDVFHLFQWTGANNFTRGQGFGTAPGNPGLANASTAPNNNNFPTIAHACAIGISGSGGPIGGAVITGAGITGFGGSTSGSLQNGFGNPWRGSMNALTGVLGIDQKANGGTNGLTGVWGQPPGSGSYASGSGVFVFPRSNDGPDGTLQWSSALGHFAENCGVISGGPGNNSDVRMHIIADDDNWVFWCDVNDSNNSSTTLSFAGMYIPRNGLPSGSQALITPYVVLNAQAALPWAVTNQSIYGGITGNNSQNGGIIGNTTGSVRNLIMDQTTNFMVDVVYNPNLALSTSAGGAGGQNQPTGSFAGAFQGGGFYDEYQIPVGIFETTPQITGYLGVIDFVRSMFNVSTPGVRWDFARTFVGSQTINDRKYSIPWDTQNKTVPRTGTTRQGITFVRPGPA